MEPQIRYCATSDGISIAYYVMGEGPPIVRASTTFGSHLLLERGMAGIRPTLEALERHHTVVRFDGRGSGLSQHEASDFSLAARLFDLESVVDHLGLDRFVLDGPYHSGLAAVAYTARHPERVTHLILNDAFARGRDRYEASAAIRARTALRPSTKEEWEYYAFAAASADFQFADVERIRDRAALIQASGDPNTILRFRDATLQIDVTDLLAQIRVPTLVLCRPSQQYAQPQSSQRLAAGIPGARLVVLDPWSGNGVDESWLAAIGEFLGDAKLGVAREAPAATVKRPEETSALRIILFTDIVGHTEMMQRLGDARGRDVLREHERITRELLKAHGGAEVKTMGDGFMASFRSVTRAMDCAIALQRAFAGHTETMLEPLQIRVGLNAGEPIEEDGDLFGSAVILASRIAAAAGPGEILIPEPVRHLLSGKRFAFSARGEFAMKGFGDAVHLYEVGWRD